MSHESSSGMARALRKVREREGEHVMRAPLYRPTRDSTFVGYRIVRGERCTLAAYPIYSLCHVTWPG